MNLKDKNKLYNELESTKHELVTVKVMLEQKDETLKTCTNQIQHLEKIAAENQVSVILWTHDFLKILFVYVYLHLVYM